MRKTLTDKGVLALKPRPQRYAYPDPGLRGISPHPAFRFALVRHRRPHAGRAAGMVGDRRRRRDGHRRGPQTGAHGHRPGPARVASLRGPPDRPESFEDVAQQWLQRHAKAKGLRSEKQIMRLLRVQVYPQWPDRRYRPSPQRRCRPARYVEDNTARAGRLRAGHRALDHELVRRPERRLPVAVRARNAAAAAERAGARAHPRR